MKRLLLTLIFLMSSTAALYAAKSCCECKTFAHSTIFVRTPFQVSSPERLAHFRDDRVELVECGWLGAIQVVPLGGKSVNPHDIATYWGPSCKQCLLVNEDVTDLDTDILANHLNIYTVNGNFSSRVDFEFHHSFAGVGFYWQQEIYHTESGRAIWLSVALPVLNIRNRVNINERIINDGGGILTGIVGTEQQTFVRDGQCLGCIDSSTLPIPRIGSVKAAFAQPGWCFGRIHSGCSMDKTRLSNIEVRAGLQIANNEHAHMESWAGVNIPTGNRRNGIQVFEPIVGESGHYGAFIGSSFGLQVYDNECWDLLIFSEFDFNIQYFFAHHETRSLDLVNRPFSRYMQFYGSFDQAELAFNNSMGLGDASIAATLHTPGINLLTQRLNVKPGFARTFNAAWDLLWRCWELEVGYNFYARQAECVEFACPFPEDIALKKIGSEIFMGGEGTTDPSQFINNNFFQANTGYLFPNYQVITRADVNLHSAESTAYLSHTVYASLAYDWLACDYPVFTSIGGSYEFAPDNTGIEKWMVFGKFGISF